MRLLKVCWSAVLSAAFLITIVACGDAIARDDFGREARPGSWKQDATLSDIFFLNSSLGWAVGDQGVILRTTNGGAEWIELSDAGRDFGLQQGLSQKLQNMRPLTRAHELRPITCSWHSIHFVDEKNGWVAGSYQTAYVDRQRAIVMVTRDGGLSWHFVQGLVLPKIARLQFRDARNGWAIGDCGNLYKSGVFYSADGGQSWSNQGNKRLRSWSDGDEIENGFVTVDREGRLGVIQVNEFEPSVVLEKNPGWIRAVRMVDNSIGWAVGLNGVILETRDGGLSWSTPECTGSLQAVLGHFDFSTIAVFDQRVWIAGNPGTYVYSINLEAGQLLRHRTPVAGPLTKLFFVSSTHGWATGHLGTIIATVDGGETWQVQRQAETKIAILGVATDSRELPLEIYAAYASEENLLAGSYVLQSTEKDSGCDALTRLGCSVNLRSPGSSSEYEDALRDLVRSVRTMQPSIVVCGSAGQANDAGEQFDPAAICRQAVESAGDRTKFTDQLTEAGLTTWRVPRLLVRSAYKNNHRQTDFFELEGSILLPRSGQLLEDRIAISRALLGLPMTRGISVSYRNESFFAGPPLHDNNLLSGLGQQGQAIPRREGNPRIGSLGAIRRTAQKQKTFQQLLTQKVSTPAQAIAWRRQIQLLGNGQDTSEIGVWMWQLADDYFEKGEFEMAARTLEMMIGRVGNHSLTTAALIWLAQYYASEELMIPMATTVPEDESKLDELEGIDTLIEESGAKVINARAEVREVDKNGITHLIWQPVEDEPRDSASRANQEHQSGERLRLRKSRLELAGKYFNALRQRDPDLTINEDLRFIDATITRKLEGPVIAENLYRTLVRNSTDVTLATSAARRELTLRKNEADTQISSEFTPCYRTLQPPHLDGKLEDETWQAAMAAGKVSFKTMTTRDQTAKPRTDFLIFAFDDQFLYFAARCHKIAGQSYQRTDHPRPRDPDLSNRDRVVLALDVDRDYRSSFRLTVDHRGWVGDNCAGSSGWNPQWFVAADQDEKAWTIECAIPLGEIALVPGDRDDVVALSTRRLSYDSFDLWSDDKPSNARRPETGLLQALSLSAGKTKLLKFPAPDESATKAEESGKN